MDRKDWIALGTLLVSGLAAYAAWDARNAAQRLEERQFESGTTIDLLGAAFEEVVLQDDSCRAATSCIFVSILGQTEEEARGEPPFYVQDFVRQVDEAGLWSADCATRLEALSGIEPAAGPAVAAEAAEASSPNAQTEGPARIREWHALIASYDVSEFGCSQARKDVSEFADLLSGRDLDGMSVYMVRTSISDNYVTTVDAGDDRELARRVSAKVRSVSGSSEDELTNADSFVQGNRQWFIDRDCSRLAVISE